MTEHTTPAPLSSGEIGSFARALRSERGTTLREAASELDVSVSALSQAERNAVSLYRLAIRAANHHFNRLVDAGHYKPGRVEERIQVVGGMLTALARFRGPESDRRAGLLRQSLLARGIRMEQKDRFAIVRFPANTVSVDLSTTHVLVWNGDPDETPDARKGRKNAGFIVGVADLVDGLTGEQWGLVIDRFASVLTSALAKGSLDLDRLRKGISQPVPSSPAPDQTTLPADVPMTR